MSMLRSRNPAMGVFEQARDERLSHDDIAARGKVMTLNGTINATAILLAIVATVAMLVYTPLAKGLEIAIANNVSYVPPGWLMPAIGVSIAGGFAVSFLIYRKPKSARFIAPVHAIAEGVLVGLMSFVIPLQFLGENSPTIVIQALVATFAIAGAILLGYATGLLRVGALLQKIMITLGIGIAIYWVSLMLLPLVGVSIWNGFADAGPIGIGFTAVCLILASLFLLLDFQYIEAGIANRAPKYMEWVGAWGLMVTLVWLYIEVLRLLAKLYGNRD